MPRYIETPGASSRSGKALRSGISSNRQHELNHTARPYNSSSVGRNCQGSLSGVLVARWVGTRPNQVHSLLRGHIVRTSGAAQS